MSMFPQRQMSIFYTAMREPSGDHEVEAQAQADAAEAEGKAHPGVPDDKAQRNFTDGESRIMPTSGDQDFLQAYNCQAVVDSEHQVIVAARATNQAWDLVFRRMALAMVMSPGASTVCRVGGPSW